MGSIYRRPNVNFVHSLKLGAERVCACQLNKQIPKHSWVEVVLDFLVIFCDRHNIPPSGCNRYPSTPASIPTYRWYLTQTILMFEIPGSTLPWYHSQRGPASHVFHSVFDREWVLGLLQYRIQASSTNSGSSIQSLILDYGKGCYPLILAIVPSE